MTKSNDYIFVLWGHNFEEHIATTFITQLREAGLLVKVVGLTPGQISGAHGLALVPDLTLGKALALAAQALCIIIPCASTDIALLKNDPRLGELLEQAYINGARFVAELAKTSPALLPVPVSEIILYPEEQELTSFVRELVGLLSKRSEA